MKKSTVLSLAGILLISISAFFFYLCYVNLSTDTIILFISQKIYLGKWLLTGVVPLYNPYLYAGIPFLFDPGMGHLHPFNLFFLFPYPVSFALWSGTTTFLFLFGFFLLFRTFSRNDLVAFMITLVLFFSGSGFWRTNNPAISLVIAHYGLFAFGMLTLKDRQISPVMLVTGFFMTISGHIQFVFYGYIIAFLIGWLFFRISFKRLIVNFFLLALITSWFYLMSLPIVLSSTRLTTHKNYTAMGPLHPFQLLQLVFPLFFGFVLNGSKWNVGPIFVILISSLFVPALIYLLIIRKAGFALLAVFAVFMAATLGLINFPFFRGAAQSFIVIHILGLILIAQNTDLLVKAFTRLDKRLLFAGVILSVVSFIFFATPIFSIFFGFLYRLVKKQPSLFYDPPTVGAIGWIIGLNFLSFILLFAVALIATNRKKIALFLLLAFIIVEGIFVNYYHNYFIPSRVLTHAKPLPANIDRRLYRVQTGADVIPYFGFHNYMSEVLFRPPFSKEPTMFTNEEQKSFSWLSTIFSFYPSSWGMTADINAIQGYNTFVTRRIAEYFKEPSSDYRTVYNYIIQRNSLFGESEIGLDINGIETSRITLNDDRWEHLGVRYFLTERPLQKYALLTENNGIYVYENKTAPAIYSLVDDKTVVPFKPSYLDPNRVEFNLSQNDVGKSIRIIINPEGFKASINGKDINIKTEDFVVLVPITSSGTLTVQYDPLLHLRQSLKLL